MKEVWRNRVYDNWSRVGALVALIYTAYLMLFPYGGSTFLAYKYWPFLLVFPVLLAHHFEEFGIFNVTAWFNRTVLGSDRDDYPFTRKMFFLSSCPLLWSIALVGIVITVAFGFFFIALFVLLVMLIDAWFHISYTVGEGRFYPGVATSLLLTIPLGTYTVLRFYSTGELALWELLATFILGLAITAGTVASTRRKMREKHTR